VGQDAKWAGIDGVHVTVKPDGSAGAATFLELAQPIDGPDGMRALPDGRIVVAENRSGKIVSSVSTGTKPPLRRSKTVSS
jgi:hypothetical protein